MSKPKRKFMAWTSTVRLLMGEGDRAIETVRQWAEDTKPLRKEKVRRPGLGRPEDKWLNVFIVEAVTGLRNKYPRLGASKNRATELFADLPENACAIVAAGLRKAGFKGMTDEAVANRWNRSRRRLLTYAKGKKLH